MDDRRIEVLLATIRTGSFTKAALELNCTQSAVTQTINAMEKELSCKILERNHGGVFLTETGKKLYPLILDADKSLRHLAQQAHFLSLGKSVPIRIGTFASISNTWLSKVLMAYQKENPDAVFDIKIGTENLSEWLLNDEIDLALGDSERLRAFRWFPLMEDPFYAVLPINMAQKLNKKSGDIISHQELFSLPFIMAPLNFIDKYFPWVPEKEISVRCDDDSTLLYMVEQGLGATAMPKLSIQGHNMEVSVLGLSPAVSRTLGIALSDNSSKAVLSFKDFLLSSKISI